MSLFKKEKKKQKEEIHRTAADSIPYVEMYSNGILEVSPGFFSKSYLIPDVNFKIISDEQQQQKAEDWMKFIDSFEAGVEVQVTIYNKKVDMEKFRANVSIKERGDALDEYRQEHNHMIEEKLSAAKNNLETVKILTVTVPSEDVFMARDKFAQVEPNILKGINLMTKEDIRPMTALERLEIINSIYHQNDYIPLNRTIMADGKPVDSFSLENCAKQGITSKDAIAPDSMEFSGRDMRIGHTYGRSYFISYWPSWIRGSLLSDFSKIDCCLLISVTFTQMDKDKAIKMVSRKNTDIGSDLLKTQKDASRGGYDPGLISPKTSQAKQEAERIYANITHDDINLYTTNFVITLFGADEKSLDYSEAQLKMTANRHSLTIRQLGIQNEDGLATSLPIGNNKLLNQRLLDSLAISCIIPFDVRDVKSQGGSYYGQNAVSNNLIFYNRAESPTNPNAAILGVPGAGKSFSAKKEIYNVILNTDDDVYIIDPEGEFTMFAEALGGTVVRIQNSSKYRINPFDLNLDNVDEEQGGDPVKTKSDFITSLVEIMIGGRYGLSPAELTIIGRCATNIYMEYVDYLSRRNIKYDADRAPTIREFYNELLVQPEIEAQNIALALERFVKGSMDIFSLRTNIDIHNRFVVYDIRNIGIGTKELGLYICLDNIFNKTIMNFYKGKRTWFYADEFHVIMQKQSSADYVAQIWKRFRKWNGVPCAITQNVEDMLKNESARTVINNSNFLILLGQSPLNRRQLSDLLSISEEEQKYIDRDKPGMGLLRIGDDVIPFIDDFPKDTKLYRLMTTKPSERILAK